MPEIICSCVIWWCSDLKSAEFLIKSQVNKHASPHRFQRSPLFQCKKYLLCSQTGREFCCCRAGYLQKSQHARVGSCWKYNSKQVCPLQLLPQSTISAERLSIYAAPRSIKRHSHWCLCFSSFCVHAANTWMAVLHMRSRNAAT